MIGSRIPAVRDPSPGGPRTGKQNTLVPTDKEKWVTGCKVGECIVDRGDLSVMRRLCPLDRTVSGPQQDWGDRVVNREMYREILRSLYRLLRGPGLLFRSVGGTQLSGLHRCRHPWRQRASASNEMSFVSSRTFQSIFVIKQQIPVISLLEINVSWKLWIQLRLRSTQQLFPSWSCMHRFWIPLCTLSLEPIFFITCYSISVWFCLALCSMKRQMLFV